MQTVMNGGKGDVVAQRVAIDREPEGTMRGRGTVRHVSGQIVRITV